MGLICRASLEKKTFNSLQREKMDLLMNSYAKLLRKFRLTAAVHHHHGTLYFCIVINAIYFPFETIDSGE